MEPLSTGVRSVLRGRGSVARPHVELWDTSGTPKRTATLSVTGCTTTSDATAAVPRSCTVTLAGFGALVPDTGALPAAGTYADTSGTYGDGPYGDNANRKIRGLVIPGVTELRLWDRITLEDGTTSDLAAGRYRVDSVGFRHSASGVEATVSGLDVADRIAAAGYTAPYLVARGTAVATALSNLLAHVAPGVTLTTPTTTHVTPRLAFLPVSGANPWEDLQRIAYSAGWELTTDRTGGVVAFVPQDPGSGVAVWDVTEARATAVATDLDDRSAVNTVVVYGQTAEDVPVRGVAEQLSGQWGVNSLGRRTHYPSGAPRYVQTKAQADLYAHSILRRLAGLVDQVEVSVPFLPHLDPWDLVDVTDRTLQLEDTTYRLTRVTTDRRSMATTLTVARRLA